MRGNHTDSVSEQVSRHSSTTSLQRKDTLREKMVYQSQGNEEVNSRPFLKDGHSDPATLRGATPQALAIRQIIKTTLKVKATTKTTEHPEKRPGFMERKRDLPG